MNADARSPSLVPYLVVFLASACVMVVELVASRMVAQHVGTNLFTWTSIIAVVLTGITIGNVAGGWLADRFRTRSGQLLSALLVLAGFMALAIVAAIDPVFGSSTLAPLPLPSRVLFGVTLVYFLPATILGTVSPLAATWAVSSSGRLGLTIGTLYAFGSFGAIVGTLATGFVLISTFGSVVIMVGVATVLAASSLAVNRSLGVVLGAAFVVTMATVVAFGAPSPIPPAAAEHGEVIYVRETQYQTVAVAHDPWTGVRTVVLDNLVHGFVVPDDLTALVYPYIGLYASAYQAARERLDRPLDSLHLGGGAYTLPRFLAHVYPNDIIIVAEIDPGVTEANHAAALLPRPPPFRVVHADARDVVRDLRRSGRTFDVIFADAFADYAIPYHLATVEFYRDLDAVMTDDGVALFNVIDALEQPHMLMALVETVRQVHEHVVVLGTAPSASLAGRTTFVVASSRAPIDTWSIESVAGGAGLRPEPIETETLIEALDGRVPVVLTDDFAPVERLVSHLYDLR